MPDNNQNQGKTLKETIVDITTQEEVVKEEFYLYQLQPELIEAKSTLEKVLKKLCSEDKLMELIYETSGDSSTTIIWYMGQVIKYLTVIIRNNQTLINALSGKF